MQQPLHLRLSFAASGAVSGMINNGIAYFLLLYYSQVLGLDPVLAGLAMMIALCFDAVSDPWIGWWSDRLRHRLGRRHPFLFFSIIPIPVAYYFLWNTPDLSQTGLFIYMLVLTVILRLVLTAHVIPFRALLPEITDDYDARTRYMNDLVASAWFAGTLISVGMYGWWLADTPEYPEGAGILQAEGYVTAASVSAILMFFCLAYAAFATKPHAASFSSPVATLELRESLRQIRVTLGDKNVFGVVLSGIFGAIATGTANALWAYMLSYFWRFDSTQITTMLVGQLVAAVIAFALLPLATQQRDKKVVYIVLVALCIIVSTSPVLLSVNGLFFTSESSFLFPTMFVLGAVEVMLWAMTGALFYSMIADVTEHRARATGRREEGLLFSTQSFVAKVAAGVGVWTGGLVLSVIDFPTGTASADIDSVIRDQLGWIYAPLIASLYLAAIWMLKLYKINRETHGVNVEALQSTSGSQPR